MLKAKIVNFFPNLKIVIENRKKENWEIKWICLIGCKLLTASSIHHHVHVLDG
jgi:hypothetical protein